STAFPLIANSLNSFHIQRNSLSVCYDVDKLFWNHHDLANRQVASEFLNSLVRQCNRLQISVRCVQWNDHAATNLAVHLKDDFDLIFDQEFRSVFRPGLVDDLVRRNWKLSGNQVPQFRGQVRRKWVEEQKQDSQGQDRSRFGVCKGVHENHHLSDRGVEG